MKCLSEMQKQMVAFIPRQWENRVMAQLWDMEDPSDRLRAVWAQRGGRSGWRVEDDKQRPSLADV